jgi:hypothetical protein
VTKAALGVLAAAICIPGIAGASTIGGTGGAIALQFEPSDLRAWRGDARPLRPQAPVVGEDIAFNPPTVTSPASPPPTGGVRNPLPVTGGDIPDVEAPPNPNGSEDDVVTPGQTPGEAAIIPEGPVGPNELGRPSAIGGEGNIGEAPEPSTVLLMGGALVGLGLLRKKRTS